MKVMNEFFEKGIINQKTNATLICLIPKTEEAMKVSDFRPISLTTSLYRVISKILANRISKVMKEIMG